jgi:hypothetical protein
MPMIAITTSNSTSVNPLLGEAAEDRWLEQADMDVVGITVSLKSNTTGGKLL